MRPLSFSPLAALVCLAAILAAPGSPSAQTRDQADPKPRATPNDLDTLMAQALDRRSVTRKMLNDYVLDEAETVDVVGPGGLRLYRSRREYMWYVRDGTHVRSPVKYDGVAISDEERRKYEDRWFARERRRAAREAQRKARNADQGPLPPDALEDQKLASSPVPEPRFVSESYFLEFKFEPGSYYLAGRERLENHDVLRVEYYPTTLFDAGPEDGGVKGGRDEPRDAEISRKMNKTSLVTLWVDPAERQIVKFTFDNVWLDFLPAAWLVRVDDLRASMDMGQPFPGVWLPRGLSIHAGATLANGHYDVTYAREFSNYRQAEVTTNIRIKPPGGR
jgi:hypothetical protein